MGEQLIEAVTDGNLLEVETLLKDGNDVNILTDSGYSLLHISISKGLDDISTLLIQNLINCSLQDKKGQTALHYCAFYNKFDLAEKIIHRDKACLLIADYYGNQPLWTAVFNDYGRNERRIIIELFINNDAEVHHKNKVGKSPYEIVETRPYPNLFDLFKIKG